MMGYNCNNKERQFGEVESDLVMVIFVYLTIIAHWDENGSKHYLNILGFEYHIEMKMEMKTEVSQGHDPVTPLFLVRSDHLNKARNRVNILGFE